MSEHKIPLGQTITKGMRSDFIHQLATPCASQQSTCEHSQNDSESLCHNIAKDVKSQQNDMNTDFSSDSDSDFARDSDEDDEEIEHFNAPTKKSKFRSTKYMPTKLDMIPEASVGFEETLPHRKDNAKVSTNL
eukprot:CAMPEP_0168338786 /NCGR_PEP_ID=MMETSP0213-20121227/13065_1 /TAXON_ID=151035 /ORGANISM="Euplotes harpa, Strain FSP1.4" /LENGTH=132 /DNA_ID=CAMNT_0008344677 /DNA_START=879 /DNA_END=1277 /DNA_ORIENTATION=-